MIKTLRWFLLATAVLGLAATTAAADPTAFNFRAGGMNQAIFQSEADLETITGTSNSVTGSVQVDLADPSSATGSFTIDAASFRTGIDMRDADMQGEMWLDAANHGSITFELTGVQVDGALEHATPRTATVSGNLTLRGVTQPVTATGEVAYYAIPEAERNPQIGISGNALRVEATMSVTLADFGITVPPVLNLKVAETITIELRLTGLDS